MEELTLINFDRNRIKKFKPFEDISNPSSSINAIKISYDCVYKRSSKPVMKVQELNILKKQERNIKSY